MGYARHAIKGITWMTGLQSVIRGLTFLKIAVLARVLTPTQFGVFGIAALVLALLEILTETGINVILIQSKETIDRYLDSAWVASILRGVIICLAIIISAPFVASFFNTPQALGILLLISVAPLIKGFINPAEINFQKELKFGTEFSFRTALYLADAFVAIFIAVITHSVYSIAWGLIAAAALEVILSFYLIKLRPKLRFDSNYLREIFHKGKWITGLSIFNYFGENSDNIIVGKILDTTSLGVYQMAYKISILPITEISDVMNKVIFPVYSKIQGDRVRLKSAYFKTSFISAIATISLGLVIYTYPKQIIEIILGNQWISAAGVLRVLAIYGILKSLLSSASVIFLASGRQNYLAGTMFTRFLTLIGTIVPLVLLFNLTGAAYSQIISIIVIYPVVGYFLIRIFKDDHSN